MWTFKLLLVFCALGHYAANIYEPEWSDNIPEMCAIRNIFHVVVVIAAVHILELLLVNTYHLNLID